MLPPAAPPPAGDATGGLRRIHRVGLALFAAQLLLLIAWSSLLIHRVALTHDLVFFEQAFYLISHGHLDPYSTVFHYAFWQDHGSFLLLPLAGLDLLWPHPATLLWLQDAAAVGAEALAFTWVCELAGARAAQIGDRRLVWASAAVPLVLLVANPWVVWTVSSDFHGEALTSLFLVGAARDLYAGRRRVWAWIVPVLLMGDVAASGAAAVGLSALVAGSGRRRAGLAVAGAGVAWVIVLGAIGATRGSVPSYFAPLLLGHLGHVSSSSGALNIAEAVVVHPGRAVSAAWANRLNIWANLSSAGLLGLLWRPVTVPVLLFSFEGALAHGPQASLPGFQNYPLLILAVVGTAALCLRLAERPRLSGATLRMVLAALVVNAIGWAGVWLPRLPESWLPVSPPAAATLRALSVPSGDEVVAQQGIATDLARRRFVELLFRVPTHVPITTRRVWFVFGPTQGSEPADPAAVDGVMTRLAARRGVRLVTAANGIWVFAYTPPYGVHELVLSAGSPPTVGAWTVAGPAGRVLRQGSAAGWRVRDDGHPGYVIAEDYWREPPGLVSAAVSLSVSGQAIVELWDDSTNRLLDRRPLGGTGGRATVHLRARVARSAPGGVFAGWGPWRVRPKEPATGDTLEVRLWSPGAGSRISVWSVRLSSRAAG